MPLATSPGTPTIALVRRPGTHLYGTAPDGTLPTLWEFHRTTSGRDGVTTYWMTDCYGDCDADEPLCVGFTWREVLRCLRVVT
jgi:hypothetical protein